MEHLSPTLSNTTTMKLPHPLPRSKTHSLGNWTEGSRNTIRNHFIAMLGEFCGTFLFLFFSFAPTQIAVKAMKNDLEGVINTSALFFVAAAFGASVAANVWAFYRINGGMLNPAVTLGLVLVGTVPPIRGLLVFPCQVLGGIAASGVVAALFPGPLLVNVALGAGTSIVQGLFIEMFLTIQFLMVIFMLAVEKHHATYLAPLGIGLALFICHMAAVFYTGCGVNPARATGPYVINGDVPGYFWIYWVGPALGAFIAAGIYKCFKFLGYETTNPGQDFDAPGKEIIGFLYRDEESAIAVNGGVAVQGFHARRASEEALVRKPTVPIVTVMELENGGPPSPDTVEFPRM